MNAFKNRCKRPLYRWFLDDWLQKRKMYARMFTNDNISTFVGISGNQNKVRIAKVLLHNENFSLSAAQISEYFNQILLWPSEPQWGLSQKAFNQRVISQSFVRNACMRHGSWCVWWLKPSCTYLETGINAFTDDMLDLIAWSGALPWFPSRLQRGHKTKGHISSQDEPFHRQILQNSSDSNNNQ